LTVESAVSALLAVAITWGAFAFGGVRPWAYWPLAVAAQVVGWSGLLIRRPSGSPQLAVRSLTAALAVFLLAGAVQLIPLPNATVTAISPESLALIAQYDPAANLAPPSHALSISPSDTARGLAVIASLAVLAVGASRLFGLIGVWKIASAVAVIGVLLALTGIVQKPLYAGKIYGFWAPPGGGSAFGPFVNKNHFAGWMLMAVPLTVGLLCGRMAREMRGVHSSLRERLLWLATPNASHLILLAAALGLMVLSLILTMSRSGMTAAVCAMGLAGTLAWRRYPGRQRLVAVAVLVIISVGAAGWVGFGEIAARFSQDDVHDLNGRIGPWGDAISIASHYPLAGTGLNTYGIATLFLQKFNLSVHYAQAHNDYLQLAAEGGLLLCLPAAACLVAMALTIRRRFKEETSNSTYWIRAGAVIGLLAIGVQEMVDFSLQMPGNAFLFTVVCAIAMHRTPMRLRQ
jgi:putative inorganic carbon (hco3(-)) transporter